MKPEEAESGARGAADSKKSGLRTWVWRFGYGVSSVAGFVLLFSFFHGLDDGNETQSPAATAPTTIKTSACPDPQGIWVGKTTVRVRYTPGCGVVRQRDDVGPALRIWANGDKSTALKWTTTSEPNFGDLVVSYIDMELWNSGTEEVYAKFTFPPK